MSNSTTDSSRAKRAFYAQTEIATLYEEQRFGGASGAWVHAREIQLVMALLPDYRQVLDLACGTGRLTRLLSERGRTIGIDSSAAMLEYAGRRGQAPLVQGDAFALPFAAARFDAVVALRFAFHFEHLDALLGEIARVLVPGGCAILDTYRWSPRAWLPMDPARWGGLVYAHAPSQMERAARQSGLALIRSEACFLFSPYVYRRLPLFAVKALAAWETRVPERMRSRVFWKLERRDVANRI